MMPTLHKNERNAQNVRYTTSIDVLCMPSVLLGRFFDLSYPTLVVHTIPHHTLARMLSCFACSSALFFAWASSPSILSALRRATCADGGEQWVDIACGQLRAYCCCSPGGSFDPISSGGAGELLSKSKRTRVRLPDWGTLQYIGYGGAPVLRRIGRRERAQTCITSPKREQTHLGNFIIRIISIMIKVLENWVRSLGGASVFLRELSDKIDELLCVPYRTSITLRS